MRRWSSIGAFFGSSLLFGCGHVDLIATERSEPEPLVEDGATDDDAPSVSDVSGDDDEPTDGDEPGGDDPSPDPVEPTETLTVSGRYLRDHCGAPLIMRGVTEMVIWSEDRDGVPWFSEIAKTGANAARIVWLTEGSASELDAALANVQKEGMVAVLELHDDAGDSTHEEALARQVNYFGRADVNEVVRKYERALVIELQVRKWPSAEPEQWGRMHIDALRRLREARIRVPLAIKEPSWDDDTATLTSTLQSVLSTDANALYVADVWNGTAAEYRMQAEALIAGGVPFYLSEFSGYQAATCPVVKTEVTELLRVSEELRLGWFAWSWGGVKNAGCEGEGYLDISTDGTLAGLSGWGLTVTLADPNGISRTAQPLKTLNVTRCGE